MVNVETEIKVLGACAKCDGRGRIAGFSHIAGGVCFPCGGTGSLTCDAETLRGLINRAGWDANHVMLASIEGFDSYAKHYARLLARDLFAIGSAGAREVLDHILAGECVNEYGTMFSISGRIAREIREYIIEEGRAIKSADK